MTDWEKDCSKFYGKFLNGEYAHWCPDYDGLPIDETCIDEFDNCTCNKEIISKENLRFYQDLETIKGWSK